MVMVTYDPAVPTKTVPGWSPCGGIVVMAVGVVRIPVPVYRVDTVT
jgi:hypothetical protein